VLVAVKTSDAVSVSSREGGSRRRGCAEGCLLLVVLAGGEAVVQAAEEVCEQVALRGGVSVSGLSPALDRHHRIQGPAPAGSHHSPRGSRVYAFYATREPLEIRQRTRVDLRKTFGWRALPSAIRFATRRQMSLTRVSTTSSSRAQARA